MALKKLTTFAFAALLLLAGSAQLSASKGGAAELSPNLHIVTKSQKADKKNAPGFMAFLKKSATGLGQAFVAAVNTRSHNSVKVAHKSRLRRANLAAAQKSNKSDMRIALPAACMQSAFSTAMDFHSNGESAQLVSSCAATVYIRLFEAKAGSLPPPWVHVLPKSATVADLKEDYSLIRSIFHLLRPRVSIKPGRSAPARWQPFTGRVGALSTPAATGLSQPMPVGDEPALARAKDPVRNHLTIDPARATVLLTDGTMGARSALRSHRPRDHRAQSV